MKWLELNFNIKQCKHSNSEADSLHHIFRVNPTWKVSQHICSCHVYFCNKYCVCSVSTVYQFPVHMLCELTAVETLRRWCTLWTWRSSNNEAAVIITAEWRTGSTANFESMSSTITIIIRPLSQWHEKKCGLPAHVPVHAAVSSTPRPLSNGDAGECLLIRRPTSAVAGS